MGEDFDNHRRIFDRGDDLQGSAAVRAVFDVDVEDPFEQLLNQRPIDRFPYSC